MKKVTFTIEVKRTLERMLILSEKEFVQLSVVNETKTMLKSVWKYQYAYSFWDWLGEDTW